MYDRYTNRFDPTSYDSSPVGLKATTAVDYYGLGRSLAGSLNVVEKLGARIMGFVSAAHNLYQQD
jgi:hypothetical protein